jgi:hypothetical protein
MDFSDNTFEVSVSRVTLIERKSSEKKFILPRRGRSRGTLKNFSVQELAEELATGKRTKEKFRKMSVIEAGSSEKKNGGRKFQEKRSISYHKSQKTPVIIGRGTGYIRFSESRETHEIYAQDGQARGRLTCHTSEGATYISGRTERRIQWIFSFGTG